MDSLVECPYCSTFLEAGDEAEAHVAAHLAETDRAAAAALQQRDLLRLQQQEADLVAALRAEEEEQHHAGVACGACGAVVALAELASHEEAHRLQRQLEQQSRQASSAAEAQHFQALQQMYGFAERSPHVAGGRAGRCHTCGEEGHWQFECPLNIQQIRWVMRSQWATGCAVPCRAVLRYAMLCCAVLCCAVLCCAVLCCAVLCCAVLLHQPFTPTPTPPTPSPLPPQNDPPRSNMPLLPTSPTRLTAQQRRDASPLADADVIPLLKAALIADLKAHSKAYLCGEQQSVLLVGVVLAAR